MFLDCFAHQFLDLSTVQDSTGAFYRLKSEVQCFSVTSVFGQLNHQYVVLWSCWLSYKPPFRVHLTKFV